VLPDFAFPLRPAVLARNFGREAKRRETFFFCDFAAPGDGVLSL
jgi:hypothetical protein